MRRFAPILLVICLPIALLSGSDEPKLSPAQPEVIAAHEARVDAGNRRDEAAYSRYVADECIFSNDNGHVVTKAQLMELLASCPLNTTTRLTCEKGKPAYSMAMDTWSNIVHNADSEKFEYHDSEAGRAWEYSGRYANVKYFQLTKDMYVKGQMLMLDVDMSGKWTAKQEELVKRLGLGKN